jgi:hypothetical protein
MSTVKTKFTLHPEYENFVPGVTPLEFKGLACLDSLAYRLLTLLMVLFLGGFGVVSGLIGADAYRRDELFKNDSLVTAGQTTTCEMQPASNRMMYPSYSYTYDVKGTVYEDRFTPMAAQSCEDFQPGTTIQVRYLRIDPSVTRVVDLQYPQESSYNIFLFGPLVAVIYIVILLGGQYGIARLHAVRKRLQSGYLLLEGEIVSIDFKGSYRVKVKYQFTSPLQKPMTGTTTAYRQDLKDAVLPPVGTPVAVLYADDQAHMVL